ncbi:MAG TPA: alpha/beta fold hydrolase [Leptolyngbyaceae cyanobacterium M65_K2018_010]|nr:alpha/beta fold hydrolase [Leptolyngbyaceae cyanobacterium M65_K2018_010]
MTHFFTRLIGFTALGVAIAMARPAIATPPTSPAWESTDCSTFGLNALLSAMSDCGYVTVPERHSQPDGPTIQVAVVRTRSLGNDPAPDPLFMENGGPGSTTIDTFAVGVLPNWPVLPALLQERDLVFVDQRGTGHSRPFFNCPEKTEHNIAVARNEIAPTDTQWMVACRDRSLAAGINPNAFNTIENAADIYAVAEALGYDQFNYYGVSYGTLLGQYVLEQAEEHTAQLRSAIIDGVVTTNIDFNLAATYTLSGALRNLFAACAADAQCNQTYPNLETVFLSVLDRLEQTPVPLTLKIPGTEETLETTLDRDEFLLFFEPYMAGSGNASALPKNIYQAAKGDFSWAVSAISEALRDDDSGTGMYHTVLCSRVDSIAVDPSTVFPAPYPQLLAIGESESASTKRFCELLQVEREPVFAYDNPEIPVLVLNGGYDPVTPQRYGETVARNFQNAHVYTFPGVGHGSMFAPAGTPAATCVEAIALDFLADPNQTPESSCLSEVKPRFEYE